LHAPVYAISIGGNLGSLLGLPCDRTAVLAWRLSMDLMGESYERVLDRLLVQAAGERDPGKRRILRRQITQLKAEQIKPMKLGVPPRKVWWPAACRGIVG
jgi:hypothetical protein